jgi:hypothetical protein
MTTALALEIRSVGRSFAICAGKSILGRFRAEAAAVAELERNHAFWSYWAGSIGVSVENAEHVTIWA